MLTNIKIVNEVYNDFSQLPVICNHIGDADSVHIDRYGKIRIFCSLCSCGNLYQAIWDHSELHDKQKLWETAYPEIRFNFNDAEFEIVFY